MGMFDTLIMNMQTMGFFQYMFPFLLSLAIFYGILSWALGDRLKKGPTGLVSIVLSFFVMLFAASNPGIVNFLMLLSGTTGIVATGILVVVVLLALAGFKLEDVFKGEYSKWFLVLLLILIGFIIFFGAGGGNFINMPGVIINSDFWTFIVVIVIIALAMWFMTKGDETPKAAPAGGKKD